MSYNSDYNYKVQIDFSIINFLIECCGITGAHKRSLGSVRKNSMCCPWSWSYACLSLPLLVSLPCSASTGLLCSFYSLARSLLLTGLLYPLGYAAFTTLETVSVVDLLSVCGLACVCYLTCYHIHVHVASHVWYLPFTPYLGHCFRGTGLLCDLHSILCC